MAKLLKDMTVAEARATGQEQEYSNLVAGYGQGTPSNLVAPTIKPTLPTVTAINTKPIKLPEPPKDNTTGNLGMAMDSNIAGITANTQVQTESEKAKADLAKTREGILSSFQNEGAEVEKITNDNELIQKKAQAVKIQNELTAMEKNYRDEVSTIKSNTQGKLESGVNNELNRATDRYNNNRANVSIAYNTALGDYNAAKDSVDLKVQSLKTYNENQLKMYSMIKDEVYNDMTESEKVKVNNLQREKEARANLVNDAYARIVETAAQNGASAATLSAIDAAARDPKATPATIAAAAGRYLTDPTLTTGLNGTGGINKNLQSYAAQYASTGTLPSAADMKFAGLNAGTITSMAKQMPKATGQVVSAATGVNDAKTPATEQADYARLNNIIKNSERLLQLDKERLGGVVSGTLGKVFGSEKQAEYMTVRKSIVDDMSRMQSGAALTPDEIKQYEDYLPGRLSNTFGLGVSSESKIENFTKIMNNRLNERLNTNGLSMYGYSKVKVAGEDRTVGEVIDVGGTQYRVLPDGTLTDII
jgi:hypothetical protein